MRKMRLLFVCSANTNRSPTFQQWFEKNHSDYDVKSSGCWHGYPDKIDQALLDWADWVFVMDLSHEMHLRRMYPSVVDKMRTVGVSDQYEWASYALKEIIAYWYETHFKELTDEETGTPHFPDCEGSMCHCSYRLADNGGTDNDPQ